MRPRHAIFLFLFLALGFPALSPAASRLSEPAGWLQQYLRIDTTNPPGHEERGAAFLAAILQNEGIPSRLLKSPSGRVSLYARLPSPRSGGRGLLLLHHIDVVPAGPGWTVPAFSGQVRDGYLWGRGALDDKSLGIVQLAGLIDLKRKKVPLARDIVLLAVADEENGGGEGTAWLLAKHPELFQGIEGVIGEGGRVQVSPKGKVIWWGVEVAQKRPLWLEVSTTGRGGHGSGLNPDSANHQLLQGLARLLAAPARWRVSPPVRAFCHALAPFQNALWKRIFGNIDSVITERGPKEFLMPGMGNLFLDTVQVTVLRGGDRINVIPGRAWARLDIRLLPDTDSGAFLAEVKRLLGPAVDVKVMVTSPPAPPSPAAGRLWAALAGALGKEGPVIPTFIPGFTDSRYFRQRKIPAYGVSPFKLGPLDSRGIHGPDERIPLAEIDRGAERMSRVLALYAGQAGQ